MNETIILAGIFMTLFHFDNFTDEIGRENLKFEENV